MGLIRKTASITTAGLIDFRSDKERTARSARKSAAQAKKQTKLIKQQNKLQAKQAEQES